MAASALRPSPKTTPSRSSTQSWSSNPGQVTEDGSRNPALVLASENQQQSSAKVLTLPPQQHQQTDIQTQSASSPLDQPQNGSGQYQPTGNNLEPPTVDALGQCRPTGNDQTPLAGDDLNSTVTVDAQLTHLVSRDDAAHQQHTTLLHQDA